MRPRPWAPPAAAPISVFVIALASALLALQVSLARAAGEGGNPAVPQRRVALVVGMSHYRHVPSLDNPANDARTVAETLKGLGFSLVDGAALIDLDRSSLERAIRSFGRQIGGADVALFYYAGHGVQGRDTNWLVPVGADPSSVADFDFEMVDAELVLRQMQEARTRLNIVILDACRNNPFGEHGTRGAAAGLAQMKAPEGTLISYATQPGNVARDGRDGHSPFTEALAETLRQPGLDIFQLFNKVGLIVKEKTGGEQQPWTSNSPIDGDFYFNPARPAPPLKAAPAAAIDADALFWQSIVNSTDPGSFRSYLGKFPQGVYADLARQRLASLGTAAVSRAPAAPLNHGTVPPSGDIEALYQAIPLVRTIAPGPPTGAPSDALLGKWYGKLRPSGRDFILIVRGISNGAVTAVWGVGPFRNQPGGISTRQGRLDGRHIRFEKPDAPQIDADLQPDGTLEVRWVEATGRRIALGTAKRMPQ